jgi:hypothetical protein
VRRQFLRAEEFIHTLPRAGMPRAVSARPGLRSITMRPRNG